MKSSKGLYMPVPRHIRRRRMFLLTLLAGVLAATIMANLPETSVWREIPKEAHAAPEKAATWPQKTAPFTISPTWPQGVAAAAVGAKEYGVLASYGQQSARPIASIAKTITALAILEKKPLKPGQQGPQIPITARDEQRYDEYFAQHGSVIPVKAGTSISQRQALEAMMLPSANNMSDTAAVWAFGSLENYHRYANQMLRAHGLNETHVGGDASGLSPLTTSTPKDLVRLGELALGSPTLAEIVAMPRTSNLPVAGTMPNYNKLVSIHGYTGIKLGDTDEAGITLLVSDKHQVGKETVHFIGVVLGAQKNNRPQDQMLEMMESAKRSATSKH